MTTNDNGAASPPNEDELAVSVGSFKRVIGEMADKFGKALQEQEQRNVQRAQDMLTEIKGLLGSPEYQKPASPLQNLIAELAPAIKEQLPALIRGEQQDPLDSQTMLIKKMINREAEKVAMGMIRKGLRKNMLFPDEVEEALGEKITHEPT